MELPLFFRHACCAFLLVATSNSSAFASSDLWELRSNFMASQEVQVYPSGEATAAAARGAAGRFFGFRLTVMEPDAKPVDSHIPRIVLATPERIAAPGGKQIASYFERIGVECLDTGFNFYGRSWDLPEDGFAATFEDPDRPGLPLTIWYANSEAALALYTSSLEPVWTPGLAAFRFGETELEGPLGADGSLATAVLIDRRVAWHKRIETDFSLSLSGFDIRMPKTFEVNRAESYLEVCSAARARSMAWADTPDASIDSPVAPVGRMSITVHGHVADQLELLGVADLSQVNPVLGRVHVLLAPGLPDDGGAAIGQATARQLLGPPAATWMGEGAGVYGADAWWGRPLSTWVAHLSRSGAAPSLKTICREELSSDFVSPHILGPLRGFWFGHLLETRGKEFVRTLWTGEKSLDSLDPKQLESEYREALAAVTSGQERELRQQREGRRAHVEATTWRAGAALIPGPKGAGYGSRSCAESLSELSALGANSFSLRVYAYQEDGGPSRPGMLHSERIPASVSDLELASAAADGAALGMSHMLQPHLLSKPWGNVTASLSLTNPERIEQFFVGLTPYTTHYALLAELIRSDIFCVGTGLSNTTQAPGDEGDAGKVKMGQLKESGWREQLALSGTLFTGLVTYASSTGEEARKMRFGDACDFFATEIFDSLGPGESPSAAPQLRRMVSRLNSVLENRLKYAGDAGRKLLIAGVGYASTEGAWLRPQLARGETSAESQALFYDVLATSMKSRRKIHGEVIAGIYLWNWSSFSSAGGLADRGYTPQNKSASSYLDRLFGNGE